MLQAIKKLLDQHFQQQADHIGGLFYMFHQDTAPDASAKSNFVCFLDNDMYIIDWPHCIPNLNPVENIWGIFEKAV